MAQNPSNMKGRVTGIGGIFFKSKDTEKSKKWYNEQLGLTANDYGTVFEFRHGANPDKKGYAQWSPFDADTKYFEPSKADFMVNFRVENIEAFVDQLKEAGVTICDEIEEFEYGKFVHVLDPDNNKVELWEPVDDCFTEGYEGKTTM
jgi:predicted enzyme related to lactoylglutathione lyase